jgi:23S rRNA pseudouridine1911/1915/1917 synthase
MKIKVLYEDKDILAIDKPSGISVHGDGRTKEKTIADWILKNYPKMKNVGESEVYENKNIKTEIKKPGIVHRLDRDTSGVLLLAKNEKTYQFLKNQFQNREIRKIYVAIVSGSVKNERGIINKPIGKSPKDFRRYLSGRGARGEMREAITDYKVLKRFTIGGDKFTGLEIRPKTGRTHQIRVHLKYINHPVVCDELYNPGAPCPQTIKRLALHAKSIEFKNLKGESVKVESALPLDFKKLLC